MQIPVQSKPVERTNTYTPLRYTSRGARASGQCIGANMRVLGNADSADECCRTYVGMRGYMTQTPHPTNKTGFQYNYKSHQCTQHQQQTAAVLQHMNAQFPNEANRDVSHIVGTFL